MNPGIINWSATTLKNKTKLWSDYKDISEGGGYVRQQVAYWVLNEMGKYKNLNDTDTQQQQVLWGVPGMHWSLPTDAQD